MVRSGELASPKFSLNCTECRKRKIRCDRGEPCSNCRDRGSACRKEVLRKPNRSSKRKPSTTFRQATEVSYLPAHAGLSQTAAERGLQGDDSLRSMTPTWESNDTAQLIGDPDVSMQYGQSAADSQVSGGTNLGAQSKKSRQLVASSTYKPHLTDNLDDIFFSNDILAQLFGSFDEAAAIDVNSNGVVNIAPSVPVSTPSIQNVNAAPVHDTLCISRFNKEAGVLSMKVLEEYNDILPQPQEMEAIMTALKKRTSLSSTRSDVSTLVNPTTFLAMLQQHRQVLLHLDTLLLGLLPASEVFYITCVIFYASSLDKSNSVTKERYLPFLIKLNKHMTGLDPSLTLIQACRLWSMGCMLCNEIEDAASAINIGGRAAISMGLHLYDTMAKQPAPHRPLLTDALINLSSDGCIMRAVFAIETPISPASLDPALFDPGQDLYSNRATEPSLDGRQKPLPLILRLHVSSWVFIGRYYHQRGQLRVPTEENLIPPFPVDDAEEYELKQLGAISTILYHCALELERPLSSWLSAVSFKHPSSKHKNHLDRDNGAQTNRALHMLYLIRYYRILINYPFILVKRDSREAVMEAARSTINTTWRLARQCATGFQDNIALYGRICLRAISFLAACRSHQQGIYNTDLLGMDARSIISEKDQVGPDKDEQMLADMELGVDALDKMDRLLQGSTSLASLASAHLSKVSAGA